MLQRRAAPVLLLLLLAGACGRSPTENEALPRVIAACERNTAEVCGTWTRQGSTNTYQAVWPQGSQAVITAVRFDDDVVSFTREDTAGPTPDMKATYTGIPEGRQVTGGQVVWNTGGQTFSGSWRASW